MKILLVIPINKNAFQIASDLGLGYLASALRRDKHEVFILDCINKKMNFDRFEKYIFNDNSDIVGLKITTDLPSAQKCIQIVKRCKPSIKILIGGIYPSSSPQESLNYFPEVDFGFKGEAEIGLPMLLNVLPNPTLKDLSSIPGLIYRNNDSILNTPSIYLDDLDSLDMPAWDLIDPREYDFRNFLPFLKHKIAAPILATRGCPYHCKFCSIHSVAGNTVRAHSVEYIIDQIEFLIAKFGIKEVCFMDANFAARKDILRKFCYRKIKENLKFDWGCYFFRLDLLDKDTLKLMAESGCYWIAVGIESGSQRILDDMDKRLNLEVIKEKLSLIRDATNIKVLGFFIIGYPTEEEIDIRKTIKFARNLPLFLATFFGFHPILGTPIYDELRSKEEIKLNLEKVGVDRKPYIPKNISPKKFFALYRWAYISFYCRPKILFKILINISSFSQIKFLVMRVWERLIKR